MARRKAVAEIQADDPGNRVPFRPDHTETYPVPKIDAFKGEDGEKLEYAEAADIEDLALAMIREDPYFSALQNVPIDYWWRATSGVSKGRPIYGDVVRPGSRSLLRHYGGADLIVWLSVSRVAEYNLNKWQVEALVCSLLCRVMINDEGRLGLVGPDFTGFVHEIEKYGAWHPRMQDARTAIQAELPFTFDTFEPGISSEPVDIGSIRSWGSGGENGPDMTVYDTPIPDDIDPGEESAIAAAYDASRGQEVVS